MEKYEIRNKEGKVIGSIEEVSGVGTVILFSIILILLVCSVIWLPFGVWFELLPEIIDEGGGTELMVMIVPMVITVFYKMKKKHRI